jgi:hypothetical protein
LDGSGRCSGSSSAALASGFVEYDGSGGRNVEGADAARHGNAQQMIAGSANKIVESCALAAEDDDEIAGEIEFVVCCGTAFVESDDPKVAALELFEGADEVDDACDAEMLDGSGAGFDGCRAEWSGAALGEEDAIDSGAVGDAKESAEILRVFNAVEREEKARGGILCGWVGLEKILEGQEFLRMDERDDTLVIGGFSSDGELLARPLQDANSGVAALHDKAGETIIVALASDEDVIESAAAGLESFRNRMQAVENFHGISLVGVRAMKTA